LIELLNELSEVELLVWALTVGLLIGTLGAYYSRVVVGAFARALLSKGAKGRENAITLKEAGFARNYIIKNQLRNERSALRKLVYADDDEIVTLEDGSVHIKREAPISVDERAFYISEENRIFAELRYEKAGSDIIGMVIALLVFAAIAYGALMVIPKVFDFAESFFAKMS